MKRLFKLLLILLPYIMIVAIIISYYSLDNSYKINKELDNNKIVSFKYEFNFLLWYLFKTKPVTEVVVSKKTGILDSNHKIKEYELNKIFSYQWYGVGKPAHISINEKTKDIIFDVGGEAEFAWFSNYIYLLNYETGIYKTIPSKLYNGFKVFDENIFFLKKIEGNDDTYKIIISDFKGKLIGYTSPISNFIPHYIENIKYYEDKKTITLTDNKNKSFDLKIKNYDG